MAGITNYISIKQALDRLNGAVGKSLLYAMVTRGELRSTRLAGKVLIDRDHLEELLAANLHGPTPSPVAGNGPPASQGTPAGGEPKVAPVGAQNGKATHRRRQPMNGIVLW